MKSKKNKPLHITCDECGTRTKTVLTNPTHHSRLPSGRWVKMAFQNVEAEECPNCGSRYYSGETLHQMEDALQKAFRSRRRKLAA